MTDLDLEAIKDRSLGVIVGIDHETFPKSTTAQLAYDVDALIEEVESLRADKEYLSRKLKMNIRIRRDLQAKTRITDAKVERVRRAMYRELSGQYGDFTTPTIGEARAVLEAALGEDQ